MTRSKGTRWRTARIAAVLLVASTWSTFAQSAEDEAASRALFAEGRRLMAAGDYVHACPKFEDSYRLDPGIGTSYNLADCFAHIGRTASAWARFLDVAAATKAAGQTDREALARARAAALEPQLARLTVVVSQPVDGLVVKRDATIVGEAAWGVAVPVDPGPHTIEATAPHRKNWSSTLDVPPAAGSLSVEVPPLAVAPDLAPAASISFTPPIVTASADQKRRRRLSPAIVTLGAVGVAAFTAGVVFGVKFESAKNSLPGICPNTPPSGPPNPCEGGEVSEYYTLRDDAVRDLTYELVGFGVGGAALLTAAYLWWNSTPAAPSASTRIVAWPSISPSVWGLNVALRL